ncbi:MAG: hypothetical protein ACM3VT_01650 [Solirubrobacterales bacterium]
MNASTLVVLMLIFSVSHMSESLQPAPTRFTIETWNVDSNQPDPDMAALCIAETQGVHLWGLEGVQDARWAEMFRVAAAERGQLGMTGVLSPTRGSNRLLILYDPRLFDLVRFFELDWEGEPWRTPDIALRPALVAQLRHFATGQELLFMVNSLHPNWAARQSERLAKWIRGQSLPVIAVGTYWFQYNLGPRPLRCRGQAGLSSLLVDGGVHWVIPEELVKTYKGPCNTIEDFVFLANAGGRIYGQSRIVVGPDNFEDRRLTGSHRPVRATFTIVPSTPEGQLQRRIRQQLLRVKTEMNELEALIRQLPK